MCVFFFGGGGVLGAMKCELKCCQVLFNKSRAHSFQLSKPNFILMKFIYL